MKKTNNQIITEIKQQIGSLPEKLDDYVKKGDEFYNQGNFDVASGIYNLAAEVAPIDHQVHEKRLDAIEKWLK